MEDSEALNIVYLPDDSTRRKAIELSERLASRLSIEFTLGKDKHPHITIYQARFPTKNVEKLKEVIRQIVSKTRLFEIKMAEFLANVGVPGFIWWTAKKSDQLLKVHWKILDSVNPLREGLIPEGLKNYPAKEEDKMEIENYGSLLVGKRHQPHITITRIKNLSDGQKALKILGKEEHSTFTADKIALGYLGDHGTVTGIIEEFALAS